MNTSLLLPALEAEVGALLRRVRRSALERACGVHPDLGPAAYPILMHLHEHSGTHQSEVAECFGLDKGSVSRQVQHLVDIGLVDRTTDPADRRAQVLVLTPVGVRRLRRGLHTDAARLAERLGGWSDADLSALTSLLARYNASLGSES